MDVAGLLGLAALGIQTISKTINVLKTLKKLPDDLRKTLGYLERLDLLLKSLQGLPSQPQIEESKLQLLYQNVQAASVSVEVLRTRVTTQVAYLDSSDGIKQQARKAKISLDAKKLQSDIREVERTVESLHLCHSEVSRFLVSQNSADIVNVSQKVDQTISSGHDANTKLDALRAQVETLHARTNRQEEALEQASANLNALSLTLGNQVRGLNASGQHGLSIPVETQESVRKSLVAGIKSAILPEIWACLDDCQSRSFGRKVEPPGKSSVATCNDFETKSISLNEPRALIPTNYNAAYSQRHCCSPNTSSSDLDHGKSLDTSDLPSANIFGSQLASASFLFMLNLKHHITGYEREVIFHYGGNLSLFGSLAIVVQRRIIATNARIARMITLEISFTPNPSIFHRGLRLEYHWDVERGQLDSLTNIQLHFPQLLSEDDPLVRLLCQGATEEFIRLFRSGNYDVRNEIVSVSGNKSLIDRGFHKLDRSYDICVFLLQQGAKLTFPRWLRSIGDCLLADQSTALQITRLTISNGTNIDFIPTLPPVLYEGIYNVISAHPNALPNWVFLGHRSWRHRMCFDALMVEMYQSASRGFYDVSRDNEVWKLFLKRVKADVRRKDQYGDTCWSALMGECGFFRWNRSRDSVHARIFEARVKGLLEMHADPCMISGRGITPTFQAFTSYDCPWAIDLELGQLIGTLWISFLKASNIDINAVARHTFRLCGDNYDLLSLLNSYCCLDGTGWRQTCSHPFCRSLLPVFTSPKDVEAFLLSAFEKCSIYPDESWWMEEEEEPNEWDMSATSIDFTPQTIYDAEKQDMEVKWRKGRPLQE